MTSHEQWLEKQTKNMVAEIMRFLAKQKEDKGTVAMKELAINFLAGFIGAQVYAALKEKPKNPGTNKELLQFATDNFLGVKIEIQNCVAAGFQGAMQEFSGKPVEYYCQVKVIPESINKQPC